MNSIPSALVNLRDRRPTSTTPSPERLGINLPRGRSVSLANSSSNRRFQLTSSHVAPEVTRLDGYLADHCVVLFFLFAGLADRRN